MSTGNLRHMRGWNVPTECWSGGLMCTSGMLRFRRFRAEVKARERNRGDPEHRWRLVRCGTPAGHDASARIPRPRRLGDEGVWRGWIRRDVVPDERRICDGMPAVEPRRKGVDRR